MKVYVLSVGAGILVGILYALMGVRSPAPPLIALCGLLGILVGEQCVPLARRVLRGEGITQRWLVHECAPHITGIAPPAPPPAAAPANDEVSP